MKASLKNYRQSPRKVRLVADVIRGKRVDDALITLSVTNKRASKAVEKVLRSAVANAQENFGKESKDLEVKEVTVNEGVTLHRYMPRAFGRATPINKRTSHIYIALTDTTEGEEAALKKDTEAPKAKTEKKAEEKPKKAAVKKTTKKAAPKKKADNK